MKESLRKGFGFGLTSGTITTLGMIIGLHSVTTSKMVIIGGIFTIAIADALSDAMGTHISEEFEGKHSTKEIWEATVSTFVAKLLFALTFAVPVSLLELPTAITVSVVWGLFVIIVFSFLMANQQKANTLHIVLEHLIIAIVVIVITHEVGDLIATLT